MRIIIDLQGAQNGSRHRGIGRYSLSLAKALVKNRNGHQIFVLLNGLFPETLADIREGFAGILPSENFIVFHAHGPVDELASDNAWRTQAAEITREQVIRSIAPDFLLISSLIEGACDNTVTSVGHIYSPTRTAVILYDLIPYLDQEKYLGWASAKNWYFRKLDSLKRADVLLAISNSARLEVVDHLGMEEDRVINISSAVTADFTAAALPPAERKASLRQLGITRKFLMHTSALDERKNFEGLIKAFAALPKGLRREYQLVLVCKISDEDRSRLNSLAHESGLAQGEMVLTGFVHDRDLISLYSECHLFVFPSFHEGFGLPVLEAMCCGAAVIGSNTSSIPEVVGREDALFDPGSTQSIAALIEKVLSDKAFWQQLKDHAAVQAKRFSWDQSAKTAIQAMERVMAELVQRREEGAGNDELSESLNAIAAIDSPVKPSQEDLAGVANALFDNRLESCRVKALASFGEALKWRVEGPFDSTYSLALLNRETARALDQLGHFVVLHSTEGPGDFAPTPDFLAANQDLKTWHERVNQFSQSAVDVSSRNLYPPRVKDMGSPLNLLHHYAWEESGFPHQWVDDFNSSLTGITCLSTHVEKILIDNGVNVPLATSGCGVDHWERIVPDSSYRIAAKKFRFLHVSSCFPRKGVDVLLDAYGEAFSSSDDVTLVIKTFANPHNEIEEYLRQRRNKNPQYPDVQIIWGDVSDSQLKAIYQQCHVLVAPSRAEGFGLPMAEAMLSGLPVITTAWGGQLDFVTEENAWLIDYEFERAETHFSLFSSAWAKVDPEQLKIALQDARRTPLDRLRKKAEAGRDLLLRYFNWCDVTARAVAAANAWKADPALSAPVARIGWITSWNSKCGIATYSEHLIRNISGDVLVLAPVIPELEKIDLDGADCRRVWRQGKENNDFGALQKVIQAERLNVLVVQFNYGFFNFSELVEFIGAELDQGRVIIVVVHSTKDPLGVLENWQLAELLPVLSRCQRILVHSIPDLNRLKKLGLVENVALFPHGVLQYEEHEQAAATLPVIASYGFCLPHKGLSELVDAVAILKQRNMPLRLRMVNAEYPVDESRKLVAFLKKRAGQLGIDDLVEFHNDFLSDSESLTLLNDAALIVFPYQHTGESASGAVRYGLATRRPVAVTPLAIFDDIGSAAFRFDGTSADDIANGIQRVLRDLIDNSDEAQKIAQAADIWRKQHDYSVVALRLENICKALLRKNPPLNRFYYPSSPELKTFVGRVEGQALVTTGVAGGLMHGPYISLYPGRYFVRLHGQIQDDLASSARMTVTINAGQVIESIVLRSSRDGGDLIGSVLIDLDQACHDFDVGVSVFRGSKLKLTKLEICLDR